jgi:ribosomal protein S26
MHTRKEKITNKFTECIHGETMFLGEQKGEKGANRYYKCLKCGSILILSEEGVIYKIEKSSSL